MTKPLAIIAAAAALLAGCAEQQHIDRRALVERHNPKLSAVDTLASLTVGNGGFAFTVDATGLQTFPEEYANGVPLGTMSDWGWHTSENPDELHRLETLQVHDLGHGKMGIYSCQVNDSSRGKAASDWYRANPHRMHLGVIGLDLEHVGTSGLTDIEQSLNMMNGIVKSTFRASSIPYEVRTACHPDLDAVATEVNSPSHTPILFRFPYPTAKHSDCACDWTDEKHHSTHILCANGNSAKVLRRVDNTIYYVSIAWEGRAELTQTGTNTLSLQPLQDKIRVTALYSPSKPESTDERIPTFSETTAAARAHWNKFWHTGAAVDLSESTDPRANELERRIVLSQYLMAVNCAGDTPPQETGLTYNSWFGKFHLEMHYWHQAWAPLWGHPEILSHTLKWYEKALPDARIIADRQHFRGVRWMKMTDPSAGEAPSNVGSFLIWQQPHLIYLSDLVLRRTGNRNFFDAMAPMVEQTAEFMADFAVEDTATGAYNLVGYIPAQETLKASTTRNSPFELVYWRYGLKVAQNWRNMADKGTNDLWEKVINGLPALTYNEDSLYLAAENATDTYHNIRLTSDHPAVLGALGIMPLSPQVDVKVMNKTLDWVLSNWNWNKTWGWDYPMIAMCATRLGRPDDAIDILLKENRTNTYLPNGHNFQDGRLRCYLPGNGGLLTAVALMCAGYDGSTETCPGFPKDGKWVVKWENLSKLP